MATLVLSSKAILYKYCKTQAGKWKYCKAGWQGKRIKPHFVTEPKKYGALFNNTGYYVAYCDGKWYRLSEDPFESERMFVAAVNAAKKSQLDAEVATLGAQPDATADTVELKQLTLADALQLYIKDLQEREAVGAIKNATTTAGTNIATAFVNHVGQHNRVMDVTRSEALRYIAKVIRESKTHSKVTAKNHHFFVVNFFKFCDHKVFKKGDAPKITRGKPIRMYKTDELEQVYAYCNPYHRLVYESFLKTGTREAELAHLYKTNVVNDEDGWTVRIEEKEACHWHEEWTPKTWEERSIRIPAALGEALVEFGKTYVTFSPLLFPREDGHMNGHLLRDLKQVAAKAKMDPKQFRLHAFRSTFTTTLLRKGMDYTEIRQQLGHKPGSDTIYKYIAPMEGKALQAKIEEVWASESSGVTETGHARGASMPVPECEVGTAPDRGSPTKSRSE